MRKEILIATVAGIIIGLMIAFGSWRANLALKDTIPASERNAVLNITNNSDSSAKKDNPGTLTLTLSNVEDYDVLTEANLNLVGITRPNSLVAISAENEDFVIKSKDDGSFEQEIVLISGVNQVLLSTYTSDEQEVTKKLIVVYSTEFDKSLSLTE